MLTNNNASKRLKANGISIKALRNLSAGPIRERSPVYNLSLSSSSIVGAIFNRFWMNSAGSSLPGQDIYRHPHQEIRNEETHLQTHRNEVKVRICNSNDVKVWFLF